MTTLDIVVLSLFTISVICLVLLLRHFKTLQTENYTKIESIYWKDIESGLAIEDNKWYIVKFPFLYMFKGQVKEAPSRFHTNVHMSGEQIKELLKA